MKLNHTSGTWEAVLEGGRWKVRSCDGDKVIASVEKGSHDEANSKLIAASPILFEALSSLLELIGEEDLVLIPLKTATCALPKEPPVRGKSATPLRVGSGVASG
jgi:hypothetical protein